MAAMSLLGLPSEIMLEIQTFLSYGSDLAVWFTCSDLYAKVEDPNRTTKTLSCASTSESKIKACSIADLLEIERWPEYNAVEYRPVNRQDFFACCFCLRICSASKFSNAMIKGKHGKLGNGTIAERIGRFCITCVLAYGRYQRRIHFQFGGALRGHGFLYRGCSKFEQVLYSWGLQRLARL